jgi:outer membrane protein assembly factor BamB
MRTIIHPTKYLFLFVALVMIIGLAACTAKPISTTTVTTTSPAITITATQTPTPALLPAPSAGTPPPEVTQYVKDWPLSNKDYGNTRATMDSAINASNVKTLGATWVFNVPSGQSTFGSISTSPIIMGNNVYIQDLGNNTMALDLATGKQKWQTVYNIANTGPNGASVAYGKVFVSAGPYEVVALDSVTGKEIWKTTLIDITKNPSQGVNGIDIQTTAYDGLVYVSTVPGNAGVFYAGGGMGVLYALDQSTGKIVWSFNTIKDTNLWGHPEINSGGGAWYAPAIDIKSGMTYWGIANVAPFPGQKKSTGIDRDYPNGSSRPGANLYTQSLLSLDHKTGVMNWYTQVWPHDTSDYDLQIPPILASANYAEKQQDIVIAAGKMGVVYAMNRETGSLIWETEVGEHNGNDKLAAYPTDGTITILPGILGGVETPMAYADGVVYALANNLGVDYTNGLGLTLHPFKENTSDLVAIDVNTGHILWDNKLHGGGYGGATVVNDLVFTGTFDGMLYAFSRDTGAQVWSYKAPAAVNAWPSFAGDMVVWPIAGPGTVSVMGFKLGATSPAVKFVSPSDNSKLPAGDLPVNVEVTNFTITDKQGQTNVAGQGHLHFYLDVDAPTIPDKPAIPSSGIWAHVSDTNYTFKNVSAGTHTISVELVNNDHTPLNPPVVQKITVTLDTNPRLKIVQPTNGAIKKKGSITITVNTSNFNVVDKQGTTSVSGEGHIHFYMDVQPPTDPTKPAVPPSGFWAYVSGTSYTFENVPVGIHTFYVQLVNNDHTPLSTNVTDSIQVYIIDYTGGFGSQ